MGADPAKIPTPSRSAISWIDPREKGKGRVLASAGYTCEGQKRFTISEMTADWHRLNIHFMCFKIKWRWWRWWLTNDALIHVSSLCQTVGVPSFSNYRCAQPNCQSLNFIILFLQYPLRNVICPCRPFVFPIKLPPRTTLRHRSMMKTTIEQLIRCST